MAYFCYFWCALLVHPVVSVIELEMISLLPKTIPIAPALPFTLPALEVAAEAVNRDFAPNIHMSVALIYNESHKTCDDANAENPGRLAEYYYSRWRTKCVAVVGSICGGLYEAANLANEWNVLLISSGLVEENLFNTDLYPTAISLGSAFESYAMVLVDLLQENDWEHISVLVDSTAVDFYKLLGNKLIANSKNASLGFSVDLFSFNNSKPTTFSDILKRIQPKSRVIFILAKTPTAVAIMEIAQGLNMTGLEYVYFVVQPLEQDVYGKVGVLTNSSSLTNETLKTVVYVTARKSDDRVAALNRQLAEKSVELNLTAVYGKSNQPLDSFSIRATYDSVVLFARMVDELRLRSGNSFRCDGAALAAQMTKRKFWLRSGPTYITDDGTRHLDLDIYGYDTVDHQMKPVRWFNSVDTSMPWLSFKNESIYSPLLFPPPDTPPCGFSGTEGICKVGDNLRIILPPSMVVVVLLIVGLLLARHLRNVSHRNDKWWFVSEEEIPATSVADGYQTEWRDGAVWITKVPVSEGFSLRAFARCSILHQLEHIDHPNINKFYGIMLSPNSASLISGYCQRGSLLSLSKTMALDWQLKFPLLRTFVRALHYVHHSHVKYHGELAADKCLVDSRFTLKLTALGFGRLKAALARPEHEAAKGHGLAHLSIAGRHEVELLRKKDIHDCGAICWEILQEDLMESDKQPLKRSKKFVDFVIVLQSCVDSDTRHRPSIETLRKAFDSLASSKSEDVVGLVLKRVEKSTAMLESRIAAKTKELIVERAKCDALLKEMLPPLIVQKLRNKIPIQAEFFDSVSISFMDLPGFMTWIAGASPYDVVQLLNSIYTMFDDEIPKHELVQKIETISDCYMVASGVPVPVGNQHAPAVCRLAKAMQKVFALSKLDEKGLSLRAGVHSDKCAASVIGSKVPRYCLFGDAVNTASRMESNGEGGRIHLSSATANLVASEFGLVCQPRGKMQIKERSKRKPFSNDQQC